LRYFELGGMSTGLQLEAYLYGALRPTSHDHDIIAHALNERFVELGGNHPVPYAEDAVREAVRDGVGAGAGALSGDAASEGADRDDAADQDDAGSS
jgi:hypothetical protein